MNAMIEADIYGNVNSTPYHGYEDDERYRRFGRFRATPICRSSFSPSVAKGGAISGIVPMVSHHDHTEHDVMVLVNRDLADFRGSLCANVPN